jgi:hypothetical protein
MAKHAGNRDDVKDNSNYVPQHARPKWDTQDWKNYSDDHTSTTVMPAVKDRNARGKK